MVKQWYYQNVQYVVQKKSRFIKYQKAKGLLSDVGAGTLLSKAPILGDTLFYHIKNEWNSKQVFIPEMHLKQPGFTYGACGPFTKTKK